MQEMMSQMVALTAHIRPLAGVPSQPPAPEMGVTSHSTGGSKPIRKNFVEMSLSKEIIQSLGFSR